MVPRELVYVTIVLNLVGKLGALQQVHEAVAGGWARTGHYGSIALDSTVASNDGSRFSGADMGELHVVPPSAATRTSSAGAWVGMAPLCVCT